MSDRIAQILARRLAPGVRCPVVSNPSFLRQGSAISDFLAPYRVILGASDRSAAERVAQLYASLDCPILMTDSHTAELIKFAANAFLATKISFMNEIASICERVGADVREVARGMGYDQRIGAAFLDAGIGYGGETFPDDVGTLEDAATTCGAHPQLLRTVMEINRDQRRLVVHKLEQVLGALADRTIGVLGLSFKPNTDELRESPALELIHLLQGQGARVRAYDPAAIPKARAILTDVVFGRDAYETAAGCDALVLVTEWNVFKHLDLRRLRAAMAYPLFVDARNVHEPDVVTGAGFIYCGIGCPRPVYYPAPGTRVAGERDGLAASPDALSRVDMATTMP